MQNINLQPLEVIKLLVVTITTCLEYYIDCKVWFSGGLKLNWCLLLVTFVNHVNGVDLKPVLIYKAIFGPFRGYKYMLQILYIFFSSLWVF